MCGNIRTLFLFCRYLKKTVTLNNFQTIFQQEGGSVMSQKRFFIGAVELKKGRDRANRFVLCMIDLKDGRFFYPRNIHDLAVAVRTICFSHDLNLDKSYEPEPIICIKSPEPQELFRVEDGVDDIALIDEAVAELGSEDLVSGAYEDLLHSAVEDLLRERSESDSDNQIHQEEELIEFEPEIWMVDDDEGITAKSGEGRLIMALVPKDTYERRREWREYRNPMFDYDRDFSFLLEDVPEKIKLSERLLSIKTVADQFTAVSTEIDQTLHPEKAEANARSRGLRGFANSSSPDMDTFMDEMSHIEETLPKYQ